MQQIFDENLTRAGVSSVTWLTTENWVLIFFISLLFSDKGMGMFLWRIRCSIASLKISSELFMAGGGRFDTPLLLILVTEVAGPLQFSPSILILLDSLS